MTSTVTIARSLRLVILLLSLFTTGGALYLGLRRVVWIVKDRDPLQIGYVFVWLGIGGIVEILGQAVYHAPGIPPTRLAIEYTVALAMVTVGIVLVAIHGRRHPPARKGHES